MTMRTLLRTAAALLALACGPAALAQTCVGFTDVTAAASFCPNVEWMKNRGITTGCSATTYCPSDNVTRASMAIFMNRLGNALTPAVVTPVPEQDSTIQLDLSTPKVRCTTGDLAPASHPRRAYFHGKVNLYNPSANGDFITEMVYTDDGPGSTNWLAVQRTAAYQALAVNLTPINDVTTAPTGYLDLDANKTYRFAMRVSRNVGSSANAAVYCTNFVLVGNRVVTASPYDATMFAPSPDAEPPQGRALPRP